MTLAAGTRLGAYEIVSLIGSGGMGEVYRARDARLGRDVAIKILPARFANHPEALARFEREARAVASLSHPNVLAIHDVGESSGLRFVAMELLGGQVLRDVLMPGPIAVRKAVDYASQIADGLAAAHAKGVVHRDVKPENLFVTSDGRVKILDFGLASQLDTPLAHDHTTVMLTEPGVTMGTVGYMSPEQVHGGPADPRSDIFSLGVVIYEMLTGRRPFDRGTAAETMTAVLRDEPPPIESLTDVAPAPLQRLVEHCLEKSPGERFQSANDLAFALRSSLEGTTAGRSIIETRRSRGSNGRLAIAAGVVAVLVAAAFFWGRRSTGGARAVDDTAAGPTAIGFTQVTDQLGVETTPSISPDGKSVAYVKADGADSAIYVLRIGNRNPVRLTAKARGDNHEPAFSPDGERIAFRSGNGGIFLMTASGESVVRLTETGYFPSWSPDGSEIVFAHAPFVDPTHLSVLSPGLSIVTLRTGGVRVLPVPENAEQPKWSPHGTRIAYWASHGVNGQRDVWTVAATGSAMSVPVTSDPALDWNPVWSPDGRFLYFASNRGGTFNLWRIPIDEESGKTRGPAEPVTTPTTWAGYLSFSHDGSRMAFASLDPRSSLLRVPFDPGRGVVTGPPVAIVQGNRPIRDHDLSTDGQWVAFTSAGAQEDLFVARVDGTEYRRLTDDSFRDRGVSWSPDGSRLALFSDRSGTYDMWTIRTDGSDLAPRTSGTGLPGMPVWSPDGSSIAFGFSQWAIISSSGPVITKPEFQPAVGSTHQFQPTSWSRDGKRLAGVVVTGPTAAVVVYTIASRTFDWVPGELARGPTWVLPVWLSDNQRLVVRRSNGVALVDARSGAGHLLMPITGTFISRSMSVSHDNRWITFTEAATEGDVWVATLTR